MQAPMPLLAANDWPQLIVGLIVVIGYIVKLALSASKGLGSQTVPPPAPQSTKTSNRDLQKEIDIFLQDVGPRKSSPDRPAPPPKPAREPVRPQAQRQKETKRRTLQQGGSADLSREPSRGKHATPGSEIDTRKKPGRENLGADVRQHVAQHLDVNSLSRRVEQDVPNRLQLSVKEHLGEASAKLQAPAIAAATQVSVNPSARQILDLLRQPGQIRQAMIVNEVLLRPLAIRKRRDGR